MRKIQNWLPTLLLFGLLIAAALLIAQCVPPGPHSGASLVPKKDGAFYGPSAEDVARHFEQGTGVPVEDSIEPEP